LLERKTRITFNQRVFPPVLDRPEYGMGPERLR